LASLSFYPSDQIQRGTTMSKTVKLGCSAPVFMPHCNLYNQVTGCTKKGGCNYQYDYQEYHNAIKSDSIRTNDTPKQTKKMEEG